MTRRLTTAQALVEFLKQQYVERDGQRQQFFAGCFGIFGHGNVAGIGQALEQSPDFPYYLCRNEQAMVHTAAAFAKMSNRLRTLVCTTSIGPGATNMLTGAAAATINRVPVLLLPGDIFARRNVAPVLQQLESPASQDISVNGIGLVLSQRFEPGTVLAIELLISSQSFSQTLQARVLHTTAQADGRWSAGCELLDQLSDDQLRALLPSEES
jgi:TPP-dependent trihydroxycyclohexane-1,2-dione (THcHDO) dehydratase